MCARVDTTIKKLARDYCVVAETQWSRTREIFYLLRTDAVRQFLVKYNLFSRRCVTEHGCGKFLCRSHGCDASLSSVLRKRRVLCVLRRGGRCFAGSVDTCAIVAKQCSYHQEQLLSDLQSAAEKEEAEREELKKKQEKERSSLLESERKTRSDAEKVSRVLPEKFLGQATIIHGSPHAAESIGKVLNFKISFHDFEEVLNLAKMYIRYWKSMGILNGKETSSIWAEFSWRQNTSIDYAVLCSVKNWVSWVRISENEEKQWRWTFKLVLKRCWKWFSKMCVNPDY